MLQGIRRLLFLVAVVVVSLPAVLATANPASAHPASATIHTSGQTGCHTTEVTLHGNAKPDVKCLDAQGGASPDTVAENCGGHPNDLIVYQDANQKSTGGVICFKGTGFVNMTDYIINPFVSWNDQASSWSSGIWYGTFYGDINGEGPSESFSYFSTGEFDGQDGRLRNDSLSSIRIDGSV